MLVKAKEYDNSYPNAPIDQWEAEFSTSDRAKEYVRMLGKCHAGANVVDDSDNAITVNVFTDSPIF